MLAQIESAKAHVQESKSALERFTFRLNYLSSQIESFKRSIESYENQVALGQEIDREAYRLAVDKHNMYVNGYNSLLEDIKARNAAYQAEIERVNEMVRKYNSSR